MSETDRYHALHSGWRWRIPPRFNIHSACCERWADDVSRPALVVEDDSGHVGRHTYAEIRDAVERVASGLRQLGIERGDRVAIVLPQCFETVVAHFAVYRLGAVAMPLSMLFGPDALVYRLGDSAARIAIVDAAVRDALEAVSDRCPALAATVVVGGLPVGAAEHGWDDLLAQEPDLHPVAETLPTDPAVLIYTSGTTGPPKGALMPHQALLGNIPGFVASQNGFPRPGDIFWSPADWAWTGGLMDAMLPTLYFGQVLVGYRGRFSPHKAFELMARHAVTNTFLFPTALKAMMKALPSPRDHHELSLRAIMSAGEAVGDTVFAWCEKALGVTVNEMFGQTEINYIVGNSCEDWPARPGSMGRPYPGHRVAVIDDTGEPLPPGALGEVAVNRFDGHGDADPVFFLGYWNNLDATERKFSGNWCRTGDLAVTDDDGYLWYKGRSDDMFKAAGYRIGPSEVENCLVGHPAVANAAVVPKPDPERGALVKAYVVLAPGFEGDQALIEALQQHVRGQLAPYEYPKEIEFIDALPMTTTGKVQRRILRLQEEERVRTGGASS